VIRMVHIILVETSPVIIRGMESLLEMLQLRHKITITHSLEETGQACDRSNPDLVIANPLMFYHNTRAFHSLKCRHASVKWIGLVYSHYDPALLSLFDEIIAVTDHESKILSTISGLLSDNHKTTLYTSAEILSERETDVLKLLAQGMANKEIADKLNISVNTVITHRKKITQKTGIKTISGLTIYAVTQKMISVDDFNK